MFLSMAKCYFYKEKNTPETLYIYQICTSLKSKTLDWRPMEERGCVFPQASQYGDVPANCYVCKGRERPRTQIHHEQKSCFSSLVWDVHTRFSPSQGLQLPRRAFQRSSVFIKSRFLILSSPMSSSLASKFSPHLFLTVLVRRIAFMLYVQ